MLKKLAKLALMMSTLVRGGMSYDSMLGLTDPCAGAGVNYGGTYWPQYFNQYSES